MAVAEGSFFGTIKNLFGGEGEDEKKGEGGGGELSGGKLLHALTKRFNLLPGAYDNLNASKAARRLAVSQETKSV